jgi:hypothetical protein
MTIVKGRRLSLRRELEEKLKQDPELQETIAKLYGIIKSLCEYCIDK